MVKTGYKHLSRDDKTIFFLLPTIRGLISTCLTVRYGTAFLLLLLLLFPSFFFAHLVQK